MIWTVYARPIDFPNSFVARKFEVSADGAVPTSVVIVAGTLDYIRQRFVQMGLTPLTRSPGDDPKIVESWL